MSNVSIRLFSESDIGFAYESCIKEKWLHSLRTIKRLYSYEPKGCFVAEVNGKQAGHVFSFSYGKVGWIGLLIVDEKHRQSGIGTLLMKRAMSYLLDSGVETIKLEAVPEIANLYRKLGFVDEFDSLRFMRINKKGSQQTNQSIKLLKKNEIIEIAEFDSKYFGANRAQVLRRLHEDNPKHCFNYRLDSQIIGYIMCHEIETGYRMGPWVCNPHYPLIAKGLISKCMQTIRPDAKLYVGVPATNSEAVGILQDLDFELYSKSIRMYYGRKLENENVQGIFSIGGPENG